MTEIPQAEVLPPAVLVEGSRVKCPHCGKADTLVEVDVAVRWNDGEFTVEDGKVVAATWATGQTDFDQDRIQCADCLQAVSLPDLQDEEWV